MNRRRRPPLAASRNRPRAFAAFFIFAAVFFLILRPASAEDVTLIGPNEALYSLGDPLSAELRTSENVTATLEIADVIVEADRVRVRFFAHGISPAWAIKITDPRRMTGSYLPVMELGLPSGEWLTPSSASRYSLTVTDDDLILGGLSEFLTDEKADFLILNFNQLPFDTEPLAEGASFPLLLLPGDHKQRTAIENPLRVSENGITFSLMNTAEAPATSMFQPGIAVDRPGESLSGIGWVTMTAADGRSVILRRDAGYGFNLSDDNRTYLRNSYYFNANGVEGPLTIGLDTFYLTRVIDDPEPVVWATAPEIGEWASLDLTLPLDEFKAKITAYKVFASRPTDADHRHAYVRLWIDTPEAVSQIFFSADPDGSTLAGDCGVEPTTEKFACDVPIASSLVGDMILYVRSFEYRVNQPMRISWTPRRYAKSNRKPAPLTPLSYDFSGLNDEAAADPRLTDAVHALLNRGYALRGEPGWIVQKSTTVNAIPDPGHPKLINRALYGRNPFAYRTETYERIDEAGNVVETVSLQKDFDGKLVNGTWTNADFRISLPNGYRIETSNGISSGYAAPFVYGKEFLSLIGAPVKFEKAEACENDADQDLTCFTFSQSLLPEAAESRLDATLRVRIAIDLASGEWTEAETECLLSETDTTHSRCILTTAESIEWTAETPSELRSVLDRYITEY